MPIYQYALDEGHSCDQCPGRFDAHQKLAEAALTECPRCSKPVHREICAPAIMGQSSRPMQKADIERAGFTQYKKAGNGVYEKTAGKGPDTIVR
jgi:putative FmdB family regulatory protein